MWKLKDPKPVKLLIGILAANHNCLHTAAEVLANKFGEVDFTSEIWPFDKTDYYKDQTGTHILRQFISINNLIMPGKLARIKHQTNRLEQKLAKTLALPTSPLWVIWYE